MTNISLIGLSGTGKTSLGMELSKRLEMNFIDTDLAIEKCRKKDIADIFKDHGEEYFRELERKLIKSLKVERSIIATGGGIVVSPEAMEDLREISRIIYLKSDLESVYKNILKDKRNKRPLLKSKNPKESLEIMYSQRKSYYEKYADIILDISGKNKDDALKSLEDIVLNNISCSS